MAGHGKLFKFLSTLGTFRNLLTSRIAVAACQQQQSAGLRMETKEKLKSLKIPEQPKRPLTPYFRFLSEHRPLIQKEHPDWKLTQITKQCAEDWKRVNDTMKDKYKQDYDSDMVTFQERNKKFNASLTQEQTEGLELARKEKQDSKKKRLLRKRHRETGKPKGPIGSYWYFIKDRWERPENKDKKPGAIFAAYKDEWQAMSKEEKDKYFKLQEADQKRYRDQMAEWEAKMVKEGNWDIIRKDSQIATGNPSHVESSKSSSVESHKPSQTKSSKQKKPR